MESKRPDSSRPQLIIFPDDRDSSFNGFAFSDDDSTSYYMGGSRKANSVPKNEQAFPKGVYVICVSKLGERFSYYGIKAVVSLYLRYLFEQDATTISDAEDRAASTYHAFNLIANFMPLIGAYMADTYVGKFKTMMYLSIINIIGIAVLSFSSIPPDSNRVQDLSRLGLALTGLFLVAIGNGGLKACDVALGGDQFRLPEQQSHMDTFFSNFYICANIGVFLALLIIPLFRDLDCLGLNDCYILSFSIAGAVMVLATVILALGRPLYRVQKPRRNVISAFFKCIWIGVKCKFVAVVARDRHEFSPRDEQDKCASKFGGEGKKHWLDPAAEKFGTKFVLGVKDVLNVSVLFLLYPVFWSLFEQMGSRWTFQATRMNGRIGNVKVLPDQLQLANSLLVIILVKIFDLLIYPCLARKNLLKKPLQKIVTGGLVLSLAFFVSAYLEHELEADQPEPIGFQESHITIVNGVKDCRVHVTLENASYAENFTFDKTQHTDTFDTKFQMNETSELKISATKFCKNSPTMPTVSTTFLVDPGVKKSLYLWSEMENVGDLHIHVSEFNDCMKKSDMGDPYVRLVYAFAKIHGLIENNSAELRVEIRSLSKFELLADFWLNLENSSGDQNVTYIDDAGRVQVCIKIANGTSRCETEFMKPKYHELKQGGGYNFFITLIDEQNFQVVVDEVLPPNSIHIFWQLPQYFLLTAGEVMFCIPNIQFAYTQAPRSMKSVVQALYRLTLTLGNLIDLLVMAASSKLLKSQKMEFLFFALLMLVDVALLSYMATKYTYKEERTEMEANEEDDDDSCYETSKKSNIIIAINSPT